MRHYVPLGGLGFRIFVLEAYICPFKNYADMIIIIIIYLNQATWPIHTVMT